MAKVKKKSLENKVRTRIAPSPTGFPHVGTAFQALFDWVFARRYNGQFLLRIEDTDQKRLIIEAEQVLYDAFDWLGLIPDESPQVGGPVGPYRQSERLELYQQYAQQLVEQGDAYYCFCSSERLEEVRQEQRRRGIPPKYDGHCRDLSAKEVAEKLKAEKSYVVRLKVPVDEEIVVHDVLRGEVKFDSNVIDDQVLLKSNGFPTYHLAVVVDDHLMGITHIERGEEWLPSAPKHVLLYQYFNWQMPLLIHTPTLRNPDRSKLSKRKGNTSLWWYRGQGYLPEAMLNFLGLLVWKPGENQEKFSLAEMVAKFEWEEMNVTGPIFDTKKLEWLNGKYLRELELDELIERLTNWANWVVKLGEDHDNLKQTKQLLAWMNKDQAQFKKALALSQDRARTLLDFYNLLGFYFESELDYDLEDLLQKQERDLIIKALAQAKAKLASLTPYNAETWEKTIRNTADELGLSHKTLFMSLRSAVTAQRFTPPLFEVMETLGHDRSFNRIEAAIDFINQQN
jgi:glutamyl-tRNA synthetase